MQVNTFDVIERRKRIIFFKLGKLWVFKQFFDNRALFDALLNYYNKDLYRFEFKSTGARNNALKLLERNGFDYDLVEDLKGYVVQLPKSAKYAPILKNFVAFQETANERIFLMKDWPPSRRLWAWARKSMKERSPSELMQSLTLSASGWPPWFGLLPGFSSLHSTL